LLGTPVGRGGSGFADLEGLAQGLGQTGGTLNPSRQRQHSPDGMLFADVLPELGSMQQQRQQQQPAQGAAAGGASGSFGVGLAAGLRAQGGGTGEGFLGDDEDDDGMVRRGSTTG
jgi:hypothetical protein